MHTSKVLLVIKERVETRFEGCVITQRIAGVAVLSKPTREVGKREVGGRKVGIVKSATRKRECYG